VNNPFGTNFSCRVHYATVRLEAPLTPQVFETNFWEKVRYVGPYIYFDAAVTCKYSGLSSKGKKCELGYIQQCDDIDLRHTYTSGNYTQWQFSQTPLSDSDNCYPWYITGTPNQNGSLSGTQRGRGVASFVAPGEQKLEVSINDNLASNVQWWDVIRTPNYVHGTTPHELSRITRRQRFTTWLVIRLRETNDPRYLRILKKTVWEMYFEIDFDCTLGLGVRATPRNVNSRVLEHRDALPTDVIEDVNFSGPNCNADQKLYRYRSNGSRIDWIPW
jgi:hypothetical protein